jgi:putative transposase
MARPLRLEFAGALYHVTSRGDRREDIFLSDDDRQEWLAVLALVCKRFNWVVHAYCQMTNHYHFLVETVEGNLSQGMRQLNGIYTQRFNHRHGIVGHLFQGRYKAILVQKEAHLLELSRYLVLNPVRAGMVTLPQEWEWSSYAFQMRDEFAPEWLNVDWLLAQFGNRRASARLAFETFVLQGIGQASPLLATKHQLLLGDDAFVSEHRASFEGCDLRELSMAHKRSMALSLIDYEAQAENRNAAMASAYQSGAYTQAGIAKYFGVHCMTVSRAIRAHEKKKRNAECIDVRFDPGFGLTKNTFRQNHAPPFACIGKRRGNYARYLNLRKPCDIRATKGSTVVLEQGNTPIESYF